MAYRSRSVAPAGAGTPTTAPQSYTCLEQVAARGGGAAAGRDPARPGPAEAAPEERRRLAMELHDAVGTMLFTVSTGMQRLGADPDLDDAARGRLLDMEFQMAEAVAALRGTLRALVSPTGAARSTEPRPEAVLPET